MKYYQRYPQDSPVEVARKSGPCGNGDWAGFDSVYRRISQACDKMGAGPHTRLSDSHVQTMADLGSGHEERMKYRLHWLITYGWIK
jgi:hypothetical protein